MFFRLKSLLKFSPKTHSKINIVMFYTIVMILKHFLLFIWDRIDELFHTSFVTRAIASYIITFDSADDSERVGWV